MVNLSSDFIKCGEKVSFRDLERIWKDFDWPAHCKKVDEAIAPQIDSYRTARARSYAEGRHYVFMSEIKTPL